MHTIEIRKTRPEDLKRVQDLNHELFVSDQRYLNDLQTNWPYEKAGEDYFKRRIAGEGGVCLVAELQGEIVGYVAGGWSGLPAEAYRGKRAELENICVTERARSQGVGAKLVDALYEWAKNEGADYIMVDVYTANVGAIAFYKKIGFEPYSTVLWHKLS